MKDYYFLFIALALSIFAAIKQNMKKSNDINPVVGKPERSRNYFLDQLMGEGFREEETLNVLPVKRAKPVAAPASLGVSKDKKSGEIYHPGFKRTLPDLQKRNVPITVKKPFVKEVEPELESDVTAGYLEDFSLRKAFIYSEIMTRKYE